MSVCNVWEMQKKRTKVLGQCLMSILWATKLPQLSFWFQNTFVRPCTRKIRQEMYASFFLKKLLLQKKTSTFWQNGQKTWFITSCTLQNLKEKFLRKTEANFWYTNIEDFDKVVITAVRQNRGDLLLIKEGYFRELQFDITAIFSAKLLKFLYISIYFSDPPVAPICQ